MQPQAESVAPGCLTIRRQILPFDVFVRTAKEGLLVNVSIALGVSLWLQSRCVENPDPST